MIHPLWQTGFLDTQKTEIGAGLNRAIRLQQGVHIQTFWLALTGPIVGTYPVIGTGSTGPAAAIIPAGFSSTVRRTGGQTLGFTSDGIGLALKAKGTARLRFTRTQKHCRGRQTGGGT